jgi:adenine/guanine phosphoribosyltransferase-like PRPP-binding protein
VIVDDGIASGGSHDAIRRLILHQFGATVAASVFAFRHCKLSSDVQQVIESDVDQGILGVFQLCQ